MLKRNNIFSLDGEWSFILDKDDSGGEKGYMMPNLDTSLWRIATIPGTFETAAQECIGYRGTVWFRKSFSYSADDELVWLEFLSVNYRADVYINGRQAGSHSGGYIPFRFEISKYLVDGENLLCVRVNGRVSHGMLPPSHFWRGHGGIIRSVLIYSTPSVFIENVKTVKKGNSLSVTTRISNLSDETQGVSIVHTCFETDDSESDFVTVEPFAEAVSEVTLPVDNFTLWDTDNPVLYTLETRLASGLGNDNVTDYFGVRDIEAKNGRIFLNGKEITLHGVNRHEDSEKNQLATDIENSERDFRLIKELNANFVRFCHYPHSEEELYICDRLGLLVLSEIPLNATMVKIAEYDEEKTRKSLDELYVNAKTALVTMIERYFNHPSIIFWSVSNETEEREKRIRDMNNALIRLAKKCDPSRFCTHVSQGCHWDGTFEIEEPLFSYDDVICINAYVTAEYYGKCIRDGAAEHAKEFWDRNLEKFSRLYPEKPVVVTEFGYPTDKIRDGIDDEERQIEVLSYDIDAMDGRVSGYAVWHFADHAWEITENGEVFFGAKISPYGLFTRKRAEKPSAELIRNKYKLARNKHNLT
ncbi:MAG: hypothetical protein IJB86_10395 [Clostridia bacterium]|nr:hypothetical protein [Clostridia bacterium]